MEKKDLVQLKSKDLKEFRKKHHKLQDNICPILNQVIEVEQMVVDHQHKRKGDKIGGGDGYDGIIRGVIDRQANVLEGKITNAFKRLGLHNRTNLVDFLRNLADYLENPPIEAKYIHPKEEKKRKKLGKRDYNKIVKYYPKMFPNRKKVPPYPKSGKLTDKMEKLLEQANIFYELDKKPRRKKNANNVTRRNPKRIRRNKKN